MSQSPMGQPSLKDRLAFMQLECSCAHRIDFITLVQRKLAKGIDFMACLKCGTPYHTINQDQNDLVAEYLGNQGIGDVELELRVAVKLLRAEHHGGSDIDKSTGIEAAALAELRNIISSRLKPPYVHFKCSGCGVGIDEGKETYFVSPVEVRVLCPVCHDERSK